MYVLYIYNIDDINETYNILFTHTHTHIPLQRNT